MSESKKGEKNPMFGKHLSEGHRKKLSESKINNIKKSKAILQYTLDGEFIAEYPSINEVERQTKIKHGNICKVLKGKGKSAGGFIWRYKI